MINKVENQLRRKMIDKINLDLKSVQKIYHQLK